MSSLLVSGDRGRRLTGWWRADASGFGDAIHNREQIGDSLLTLRGIRGARTQRLQRAIDRLVDSVPVGCCARLQSGFSFVPFGLEVLDPGLGAGKIALVDQR